jgi:anti-sigma factor RsiW
MDARVEAYIDDALPPSEHTQFEARMWADSHWEEQVERARSIRISLRSKTPPPAPTALTDTILQHVSLSSCPENCRQ